MPRVSPTRTPQWGQSTGLVSDAVIGGGDATAHHTSRGRQRVFGRVAERGRGAARFAGDADDLVRTLVARVVRRKPEADGTVRLGPLLPGDYEVCRGDEPAGERVVVRGPETHWSLPQRR